MAEKRTPVSYTVLERSLIGNTIYEAGSTAEYDGLPAENLAPLCDIGKARYQEYLKTNADRVKQMKLANPDGTALDLEALASLLAAAMSEKSKK